MFINTPYKLNITSTIIIIKYKLNYISNLNINKNYLSCQKIITLIILNKNSNFYLKKYFFKFLQTPLIKINLVMYKYN